jgi:hypothetical protein
MKFLIDGNPPSTNHFGVDKFAWEADWNSKIGVGGGGSIVLTAASHVAPTLWTLTFTGDCKVVTRVGNWRFIDAAGRAYWMETAPATGDGGATWTLNVAADSAPTLGAGAFEYVCDPQVIPGYVLSSRLLVILEPGDVGDACEGVGVDVADRGGVYSNVEEPRQAPQVDRRRDACEGVRLGVQRVRDRHDEEARRG